MYKKILIPLDGTAQAETILFQAVALAKSEGAEVVLLRIILEPVEKFSDSNQDQIPALEQEMETEASEFLKRMVAELKRSGASVTSLLRTGPIPETILDVAGEIHADLIAMATHGRAGLQRWLLGSVADHVVRKSPVPVMLIHSN